MLLFFFFISLPFMVNKRFSYIESITNKLCVCRHNMPPVTLTLTFDHLTLKVVSESHETWATCVPILVFQASLFST